jgi:flavin-binding protein dodecin
MEDHSYKVIELVGSSTVGLEDAINNALGRAARTLHGLRWFQVTEVRGSVADGKAGHYQVTLKVGFTLDTTVQAHPRLSGT